MARGCSKSFKAFDDWTPTYVAACTAAMAAHGPMWALRVGVLARIPATWARCRVFGGSLPGRRDMRLPPAECWPNGALPVGPEYAADYARDTSDVPLRDWWRTRQISDAISGRDEAMQEARRWRGLWRDGIARSGSVTWSGGGTEEDVKRWVESARAHNRTLVALLRDCRPVDLPDGYRAPGTDAAEAPAVEHEPADWDIAALPGQDGYEAPDDCDLIAAQTCDSASPAAFMDPPAMVIPAEPEKPLAVGNPGPVPASNGDAVAMADAGQAVDMAPSADMPIAALVAPMDGGEGTGAGDMPANDPEPVATVLTPPVGHRAAYEAPRSEPARAPALRELRARYLGRARTARALGLDASGWLTAAIVAHRHLLAVLAAARRSVPVVRPRVRVQAWRQAA